MCTEHVNRKLWPYIVQDDLERNVSVLTTFTLHTVCWAEIAAVIHSAMFGSSASAWSGFFFFLSNVLAYTHIHLSRFVNFCICVARKIFINNNESAQPHTGFIPAASFPRPTATVRLDLFVVQLWHLGFGFVRNHVNKPGVRIKDRKHTNTMKNWSDEAKWLNLHSIILEFTKVCPTH